MIEGLGILLTRATAPPPAPPMMDMAPGGAPLPQPGGHLPQLALHVLHADRAAFASASIWLRVARSLDLYSELLRPRLRDATSCITCWHLILLFVGGQCCPMQLEVLTGGCSHAGAVPQPQMDVDPSASQSSTEAEGSGGMFGGWFGGSKKQEEPASGSFEAEEGFTPAPQFR